MARPGGGHDLEGKDLFSDPRVVDHRRRAEAEPIYALRIVGNNKFEISGLQIGTRQRLDGGKLWICLASEAGRLELAVLAAFALAGRVRKRDLVAFEATKVEVATRKKHQTVSSDGEVFLLANPLHYRCRARALRVIVPPDAAGDARPV